MDWITIVPGRILFCPDFIKPAEATTMQDVIRETTQWSQERLKIYGSSVPFPRLVAWYGDPGISYKYSGILHPAKNWTPILSFVRDAVLEKTLGTRYNGVLLNRYRSGEDSIGRHSDDESDLVEGASIVGLSFGVTRTIRFRPIGGKADSEIKLPLTHGSLLLMQGDCQRTWTHEIKKEPEIKGERISLTFRSVSIFHE